MKNYLILLLLSFFIGNAQNIDLVKWQRNNSNVATSAMHPLLQEATITSSSNLTISSPSTNYFRISKNNTTSTPSATNHYVDFTFKSAQDAKILLASLQLNHKRRNSRISKIEFYTSEENFIGTPNNYLDTHTYTNNNYTNTSINFKQNTFIYNIASHTKIFKLRICLVGTNQMTNGDYIEINFANTVLKGSPDNLFSNSEKLIEFKGPGTSLRPTIYNSSLVSATNIQANNVSISEIVNGKFTAGKFSTNNNTKYIHFSITALQKIKPENIKFDFAFTGSSFNLLTNELSKVMYSFNADFSNSITYESDATDIFDTPSGSVVLDLTNKSSLEPGETIYFRILVNASSLFGASRDFDASFSNIEFNARKPRELNCEFTTTFENNKWSQGPPNELTSATIAQDYTIDNTQATAINACELRVNTEKKLTITPNNIFTVKNNIIVENNGLIKVENNGALVQLSETATYTGAPTSFNLVRTTPPIHRYDYTYWSSPVVENANVFLLGKNPQNLSIAGLSPNTLASKYHSWDMATNNWINISNGNAPMVAGKGYIVRAPSLPQYGIFPSQASSYAHFTTTFIGKPNTGTINTSLIQNSWALVGNPYPSAINLDAFFDANIDLIEGTVYIWTHESPISVNQQQNTFNYNNTDYIAANALGAVSNTPRNLDNFIKKEVDNIAAGQSFFVRSKPVTSNNPKITFKNNMRVRDINQTVEFFATGNNNEAADNYATSGKHRIWVGISTPENVRNEALIGYINNATDGIDDLFDGKRFSGNIVAIYTLVNETELTIEGRGLPFNEQDKFTLGYFSSASTNLKISIDQFDGIFSNQNIYLIDKVHNTEHNLKNGAYQFQSEAGTYNDRFEIQFVPSEALGVMQPEITPSDVIIYKVGNQIGVKANTVNIKQVEVYDMQGKLLSTIFNNNSIQVTTNNLQVYNQVLIVTVTTENGTIVNHKIVM